MSIKFSMDEGAFPIARAHAADAGFDIRSREKRLVRAKSSEVFHPGVHVEIPQGGGGQIISKSGLNVNHDITSTGLIDSGYSGEIVVKLYNNGNDDYQVNVGDKISQLVIFPCVMDAAEQVEDIRGGERGSNGFGSTGK